MISLSAPRVLARHVLRHVVERLDDLEQQWVLTSDGELACGTGKHRLKVCTHHGNLSLGGVRVWLPWFKRFRLRRHARAKVLQLCLKELCNEDG